VVSNHRGRQVELYDFLERLTNEDAITVTSIKCWEEVRIRLTNMRIEALRNGNDSSNKDIIEANVDLMDMVVETAACIQKYFDNSLNHVISPEPINLLMLDKASEIMKQCNIAYPDALHSVIAAREQVDYIATLDGDYSKIINAPFSVLTNEYSYRKVLRKRGTHQQGNQKVCAVEV